MNAVKSASKSDQSRRIEKINGSPVMTVNPQATPTDCVSLFIVSLDLSTMDSLPNCRVCLQWTYVKTKCSFLLEGKMNRFVQMREKNQESQPALNSRRNDREGRGKRRNSSYKVGRFGLYQKTEVPTSVRKGQAEKFSDALPESKKLRRTTDTHLCT